MISWIVAGVGVAVLKLDIVRNFALANIPIVNSGTVDILGIALIAVALWVAEK
jgi:hypothetical protein